MKRHNLGTVVSFEVIRTLTKRRFWLATLMVPIALAIVIGLVVSSNESTISQTESQKFSKFSFTYTDASGYVNPAVVATLGGTKATDPTRAIADVKAGVVDAHFDYPADPTKQPTQVYGADNGIFDNGKYAAVATHILLTSARDKIGDNTLTTLVEGTFPVVSTTYKNGRESGGINEVIPPMGFLVIFYVVIVLLANQMAMSLLEEKENRVTEMILTTLDPTTLVAGKVVSLFIIGLVQMLAFALPVVGGYLFFRTELNMPDLDLSHLVFSPGPMIVGALILIGGFTLFTTTLVAIGAIMPTARDAGQVLAPLMVLIFVPFYTISIVVSDPHSFVVQLFTYFPYSAAVTALLRNAFGSLSMLEAAIVIAELFGLGIIVLRIAVRLFRYGSISYTDKVSLKAVFAKEK
ncbi:MAG: ABC transporter permease [Actinomycetota bacterium]|nr:MAG: ABC-2 type transport system permease [Actinomycetota bacterium]MDO8949823.1 ABC transporter permease [Actinomycetota bacterium]MDP3631549.1 ABC transporter permease [Actinomycetota bacterium]